MSTSPQQLDQTLFAELYEKIKQQCFVKKRGHLFRNALLAEQVEAPIKEIFQHLNDAQTFSFNFEQVKWQDTDGESKILTINRASKTPMWPMGTHFWVRDNAIIGQRLLALDYSKAHYPSEWQATGKEILLSTLTIASSVSQLKRFEDIIEGKKSAANPTHWPHIFLSIESNLNASEDEAWMHKQDAWQLLCYYVLEALEKGWIELKDLTSKHKRLLQLICPFLEKVQFTSSPNGGSWEEIEAMRSSVIAWETALLDKIRKSDAFFNPKAEFLFNQGIEKLRQSLPYESPDYAKKDTQYREADAALIYLFHLNVFRFFPKKEQLSLLEQTLKQIESLVSNSGIKRYKKDSYQGLSYYSNTVSSLLRKMYASPSGDSSGIEDFQQRCALVPAGHEAEWTHFVWQLSHSLGKLAAAYPEKAEEWKEKQRDYFYKGLSLITGENEYTLTEKKNKQMQVTPCSPYQLPECYNSEKIKNEIVQYPSMHTPLYWSIAECVTAFDALS